MVARPIKTNAAQSVAQKRSAQVQILNMYGFNAQFCMYYLHVHELADTCRILNIVDVSHEASIIDTSQAITSLCYGKSKRDCAKQIFIDC